MVTDIDIPRIIQTIAILNFVNMIDVIIDALKRCFNPRLSYQLPTVGSRWILFMNKHAPIYTVIATYHGDNGSPVCIKNDELNDYKEINIIEFVKNWREVGFDANVYNKYRGIYIEIKAELNK